jgi:hypothetical protein
MSLRAGGGRRKSVVLPKAIQGFGNWNGSDSYDDLYQCYRRGDGTVPSVPDSNWLSSLSADHRSRSSCTLAFYGVVREFLQLSAILPYAFVRFQSFRLAKT